MRTHSDDNDAGRFDAIDAIGSFAFVVTRVVGIDIRDPEAAAVRTGTGAVLPDNDAALLFQHRRLILVPAETIRWRIARHLTAQFNAVAALLGRVAQRFDHLQ